jgi:hypothetical protein
VENRRSSVFGSAFLIFDAEAHRARAAVSVGALLDLPGDVSAMKSKLLQKIPGQ